MRESDGGGRTFLVECYKSGLDQAEVESAAERVATASAELRAEGHGVEYVGAILVPADEAVFHVFAAESADTVREASLRASVQHERVVESVAVGRLQLSGKHVEPHPEP
jgi:hypothetical protein